MPDGSSSARTTADGSKKKRAKKINAAQPNFRPVKSPCVIIVAPKRCGELATGSLQIQQQNPVKKNPDIYSGIVYVCIAGFPPLYRGMVNSARHLLGQNVRRFRQKHGWSQERLAEKADMHWTFISGVERAKYNISLDSISRLAKALGCRPYELLK
jgi:DNA-binding XRE family transcriptional regulator